MTDAMAAGTVRLTGHGGDDIEAYLARPVDRTGFGSVVVLHHMPGYDEPSKEITRRFASRGYAALMPNLHYRDAPAASPDDAAAASRANGGVPDDRLVGDVSAAVSYLKALDGANGKAGIIGYCSGGRQSFLAACKLPLDAAVDCYGAAIVRAPEGLPIKMTPIVCRLNVLDEALTANVRIAPAAIRMRLTPIPMNAPLVEALVSGTEDSAIWAVDSSLCLPS